MAKNAGSDIANSKDVSKLPLLTQKHHVRTSNDSFHTEHTAFMHLCKHVLASKRAMLKFFFKFNFSKSHF